MNNYYDVNGLLTVVWRSHSGQIVWGISKTPSTPSTPSPLDPLAPRPTTLDLILKTVFVSLYNYNFCIILTFGKFI